MAKKQFESLPTPDVEPLEKPVESKKADAKGKKNDKKAKKKKRNSVGKFFRDIISELKKVSWAGFKSTKSTKGVLAQTGTVLLIVAIFIVVITAMDIGLSALLDVVIKAGI